MDEALRPRGKRTVRIEAIAEAEIGCAITIRSRQLSGVDKGPVPYGFRAQAIRELLAAGATALGLGPEANRMADTIRAQESHE